MQRDDLLFDFAAALCTLGYHSSERCSVSGAVLSLMVAVTAGVGDVAVEAACMSERSHDLCLSIAATAAAAAVAAVAVLDTSVAVAAAADDELESDLASLMVADSQHASPRAGPQQRD